jgi:heat shock protein HslJ
MKKVMFSISISTLIAIIISCSVPKNITSNNADNASDSDYNYPLIETYWKLIELNGQPITPTENRKEAFIILKKEENKVNGHSSCNNFRGTYALTNETQLSFSKMASTMMACPDMNTEKTFLDALQRVDNFAIKGKILSLSKAKMAPIAKFEAVLKK